MRSITKIRNKLKGLELEMARAIAVSPKDEDLYGQMLDHIKTCEQLLLVAKESSV
jgi:hypothetical protein